MDAPNQKQRLLLRLVHLNRDLDHEDERLAMFCDDVEPVDTFNQCHDAGWLKSWHDNRSDSSTVTITKFGRDVLAST